MKRWVLISAVSTEMQLEGDSPADQLRRLRAACASYDGIVIDEIEVPGISRAFIDWHELKSYALNERKSNVFHRIEEHWRARDFDVMAAVDATRMWRTDALTVYGMARIYEAGGKFYSCRDGFIDEANRSMFSLMAGFQTQKEIESLRARWRVGTTARINRGLPGTGRLPFFLRFIVDEKGKHIGVEKNPDYQHSLDKIAEVFLAGEPFNTMGQRLYEQYGLLHPSGRVFSGSYFKAMLTAPSTWGHAAYYASRHIRKDRGMQDWVFGPGFPIPPGVVITYNAFAPAYEEPLRSEIISEFKRRRMTRKGNSRTWNISPLTGLVICGECGSVVNYRRQGKNGDKWYSFHCGNARHGLCDQPTVKSKVVETFFRDVVAAALEGRQFLVPSQTDLRLPKVQKEIARIEAKIDRAITDSLSASPEVAKRYTIVAERLGKELDGLRREETMLQRIIREDEDRRANQIAAAARIGQYSDRFWELPAAEVNRLLHLLFDQMRVVVRDRKVVGIDVLPST